MVKVNIAEIKEKLSSLGQVNAVVGFDACVDHIVKVIRHKSGSDIGYFEGMQEFGNYIASKANKSCGLDLRTQVTKIGGNMAITSHALGTFGVKTTCIGTFGFPGILPVFQSFSQNCQLVTIGETVASTAIEFDDGKVIMCDLKPYEELNWQLVKERVGMERLTEIFRTARLVAFLNWSEIEQSSDIWEGFIAEILPVLKIQQERPFFLCDLSDCSRKPKSEIVKLLSLFRYLLNFYKVIISLNQNEAELVANALELAVVPNNTELLLKELKAKTEADMVLIHRTTDAWAISDNEIRYANTFFVPKPVLLTGGGDNFNAGFCFAILSGLNLNDSLVFANATSGFYVQNGYSPQTSEIIDFLEGL